MASRPCIRVAYTARAVLPTTHELDSLAERTLRELRRLGPFQRDAIIERLLRGHGATAVAGELLSVYRRKGARRLPPLIRDSVSH